MRLIYILMRRFPARFPLPGAPCRAGAGTTTPGVPRGGPSRAAPPLPAGPGGAERAVRSAAGSNPGGAAPAMNFSELFKLSGLLGRFSPDGKCLVSGGRGEQGRAAWDGAVGGVPERPRRGAPRAGPG